MAKHLAKALVFLLIPNTLLSAQMSSGHGILYKRFDLLLGKTRKFYFYWEVIFPDIPERKKGVRARWGSDFRKLVMCLDYGWMAILIPHVLDF